MGKVSIVILILIFIFVVGFGINYVVNYYGSFNYEWKRGFMNYNIYNFVGNLVFNGYIKVDGDVSVYIFIKENFKKMKNGEFFSYYKVWEYVWSVEFDGIKIFDGDYIFVVKNEGEGMRWILVKIVNKKE